jgi:glycosylphosphatidylinositol transamidase
VHKIEHVVRAMSNLHEKLHHSVTQYLLVSPKKFVSSAEYIFPIILMLAPLAIRAFGLFFKEIQPCFQIQVASFVVSVAWVGMALLRHLLTFTPFRAGAAKKVAFSAIYAGILAIMLKIMLRSNFGVDTCSKKTKQARLLSIQLATCCLAIYAQAPLLYTNYSVVLPSALVWTPCISMLQFTGRESNKRNYSKTLSLAIAFLTSPPSLLLLCEGMFSACENYWILLYSPLQLTATILLIMG